MRLGESPVPECQRASFIVMTWGAGPVCSLRLPAAVFHPLWMTENLQRTLLKAGPLAGGPGLFPVHLWGTAAKTLESPASLQKQEAH